MGQTIKLKFLRTSSALCSTRELPSDFQMFLQPTGTPQKCVRSVVSHGL